MAARMIAEKRMSGTIDQIDGVLYFKSKTSLIHGLSKQTHSACLTVFFAQTINNPSKCGCSATLFAYTILLTRKQKILGLTLDFLHIFEPCLY